MPSIEQLRIKNSDLRAQLAELRIHCGTVIAELTRRAKAMANLHEQLAHEATTRELLRKMDPDDYRTLRSMRRMDDGLVYADPTLRPPRPPRLPASAGGARVRRRSPAA
jgi:hypothetical protein